MLNAAKGRIAYRLHARDLHLVMGSAAREASVRLRVLIDCSRGDRVTGQQIPRLPTTLRACHHQTEWPRMLKAAFSRLGQRNTKRRFASSA